MRYFETIFLQEVDEFLETLDDKSKKKVILNVRVAEQVTDPKLFKKLNDNIWEFRTNFLKKQIRLLAFWDRRGSKETLVLATHGFIKKTQKTPKSEIDRAERIRESYYRDKKSNDKKAKK